MYITSNANLTMLRSTTLKVNTRDWVSHFEQQAKSGTSERSSFNRHFITLGKIPSYKIEGENVNFQSTATPIEIVSPIQQVTDQAEEEIKNNSDSELLHLSKSKLEEGLIPNTVNTTKRKNHKENSNGNGNGHKKRRIIRESGKVIFNDIFQS